MVSYDAFLLVSFGGPERPEDVTSFLANVTRGRGVPPERLAEVAEHYRSFGGVSPINEQCRQLLAALANDFTAHGVVLPIYWGNRNWHPLLADTMRRMRADGVRRAIALVTSPYGSYSSCRQYLEDIATARAALGPDAPVVDKIRHYHDDPGLIEPLADAVRAARSTVDQPAETTRLVFTAHSIPLSMAQTAGPDGGRYEAQLRETASLVAAAAAPDLAWDLVWQSRSGPPRIPWLEPDVNDHLHTLADTGVTGVIASPIGFVSDHLEVVWDLDTEAAATAKRLGMAYARAATPGTDPRFVAMVRRLVQERLNDTGPQHRLGSLDVWNSCVNYCCPAPRRRGANTS
ncbi:MAG TPA: ferrochelatase [Micromonosporaceae bacterium]|nr:ferrochelatase [Micromonosporaceae bacterium]